MGIRAKKEQTAVALAGEAGISFTTGRGMGISREPPLLKNQTVHLECATCQAGAGPPRLQASYLILPPSYCEGDLTLWFDRWEKWGSRVPRGCQHVKEAVESGLHLVPRSPGNVTVHFSQRYPSPGVGGVGEKASCLPCPQCPPSPPPTTKSFLTIVRKRKYLSMQ